MAKSAKKQREKKPTQDEANTPIDSFSKQNGAAINTNSNIFNSLFGAIPDGNAAVSIFSDNNPFRRKPNDSPQAPANSQEVESGVEISGTTVEGSSEMNKKKRKKDRNVRFDVETKLSEENESEDRKKPKRDEFGDSESAKGRDGTNSGQKALNFGNENLKSDSKITEPVDGHHEEKTYEKKKKKKRRRDEVEAEYEVKKYGVTEQEERGEEGGVVGRKRKELESVTDIMVSKEGFDDESKLLRTVFVGNLPLKIKKKLLVKEFGKFGELESVRIRSVPLTDSKVPRKGAIIKNQINEAADSVHAYVVFKTEESARASLAHNMAVVGPIPVGGNHIRVDRACPPRKKLKIGDDAPLYDNRRTVFVGNLPFNVKDAANLAARKHNLKLRDRALRLAHAKANATPSKRKTPLTPETNKSPAKKFAGKVGYPGQENSVNSKPALSYQGLRASKPGKPKKAYSKTNPVPQNAPKPKVRLQKRPTVAARKAIALKAKEAGIKRKSENQTPGSNSRGKKARKFT